MRRLHIVLCLPLTEGNPIVVPPCVSPAHSLNLKYDAHARLALFMRRRPGPYGGDRGSFIGTGQKFGSIFGVWKVCEAPLDIAVRVHVSTSSPSSLSRNFVHDHARQENRGS